MRFALGMLGWTPETFWNSTPPELRLAFEGFAKMHGLDKAKENAPVTSDELEELEKRINSNGRS